MHCGEMAPPTGRCRRLRSGIKVIGRGSTSDRTPRPGQIRPVAAVSRRRGSHRDHGVVARPFRVATTTVCICHDVNMAALLWLIGGLLALGAELLFAEFTMAMLGVAALSAAGVGLVGAPVWAQFLVFAVVAIGLVTVARPMLRRRLHYGHHTKTNVDALVGTKAIVLATVDANTGQVKIGGETWSARTYDETQVLEPGRTVTVMDISGATAVVWGEG